MKTLREKASILSFASFSKGLIISIIVLIFCASASSDQSELSLMVHNNQRYILKSETIRVVTAYNAGDPQQTDDTPCISANGENLCIALEKGHMRCAANFVPLGSQLYVDKIGVCLVTDRTNKRYRNRVDIAMQKDECDKARRFGRQKLHVKIIMPVEYEKYYASCP